MNIYFIGIAGIAMGNLALMLKKLGHEVSGSDHSVYPPMSTKLDQWNIKYHNGFSKSNILDSYDLFIIGNSISRGNIEVEEVLNRQKNYLSMPEAISKFLLKNKKVIVIAGTHGKTTTTFLIHHILKENNIKPGLFVGGIRQDSLEGCEITEGDFFVIEGDEYDSAFFDKASKFLHYKPYYLAITSLDFDHADIFKNIEEIKNMFFRLMKIVPSIGKVFFWDGANEIKKNLKFFPFLNFKNYTINKKDSEIFYKKGKIFHTKTNKEIHTTLMGKHNARNIELAFGICKEIIKNDELGIIKSIESFPGVKRRQEILFQSENSILIEDFAHHPVAVFETIQAVKEKFPNYQIIALFEPRSATSHRNVFQAEYVTAFNKANYCFITELFNIHKVSKIERLNVKKLIMDIGKKNKTVSTYCKNSDDLLKKMEKTLKDLKRTKKIVLAMSNGAFGGIYPKLTELMKKYE